MLGRRMLLRMPCRSRALALLVAAVLAAAALAACGGASNSASTTPVATQTVTITTPSTPTAADTVTTTTSAAATTTPTTTTTAATSSACVAADLQPVFLGTNGATGNVVVGVALENRSTSTCHTYGWPGVAFLDSSGAALSVTPSRTTTDLMGQTSATDLSIAPGREASFRLVVPDQNSSGGTTGCASVSGIQIIAPNDTAPLNVSVPNAFTECGSATLSPLLAGDTADPGA